MKRTIALFLAILFVFTLVPVSALAADKTVTFNVEYTDGTNNLPGSPVSFTRTYDDATGVLLDGQEGTQVLSYEQSDKVITSVSIQHDLANAGTFTDVETVTNPAYTYTVPQGSKMPGAGRTSVKIKVSITCNAPKVTYGASISEVKADGVDLSTNGEPAIGAIITGKAALTSGTAKLLRVTAGDATVALNAETGEFHFAMPKANVSITPVYGDEITLQTEPTGTVLEKKSVPASGTATFTVTEPDDELITAPDGASLTVTPAGGTATYNKNAGTVAFIAASGGGAATIEIPSTKLHTVNLSGCELVSANEDHKISTAGDVVYVPNGTVLTLRATTEEESYKWTYNGTTATEKTREITTNGITEDCTFTASKLTTFTVTKDAATPSSVTVTITGKDKDTGAAKSSPFEVGDTVTIKAEPAANFKRWSITGIGAEIAAVDLSKNPLTFTMPSANVTVLPIYEAKLVVTEGTATFSTSPITPTSSTINGKTARTYANVPSNATVTITRDVQPTNEGTYTFVRWTSNSTRISQSDSRGNASMSFVMPPDDVNAEPVWQTYTLTVRRYVNSGTVETFTLRPGEYVTLDAQVPTGGTTFNYWTHTDGMLMTVNSINEVMNQPSTERITIQMPAGDAWVTANYTATSTDYKMTGAHIVMISEPVRYYALNEYFNKTGLSVYYYPNWEEKNGVLVDNSQLAYNIFDPASGNTNSVLANDGAFNKAGKFALQLTFYVNGEQMAETITVLNTANTYINVSSARPEYVVAYAPNNVLNYPLYFSGEGTSSINKDGLAVTLVSADHTAGEYNSFRTLLPSEYDLVIYNPLTGYDANRIPEYADIVAAVTANKSGYKRDGSKYYVQLGILAYDENQIDSATGKPKQMNYIPGDGNDIWIEVRNSEGIDIDLTNFDPADEVTKKSATWPSYSWEINYSEIAQGRSFDIDLPDLGAIDAIAVTNEDSTVAYVTVPDSKNPLSYRLIPRSVGVTKFTFYVRGFELLDADVPNEGDATPRSTMVTLEVTVRDDVGGIINMTNLSDLNQTSMTMYVGSKTTLYPAVYSPNNANTTMSWSVAFKDDKEPYNAEYYVKVDPVTGVVEALKYTDRVIYVYGQAVNFEGTKSVADGTGKFPAAAKDVALCAITLAEIPVYSMTLYPAETTLFNKASMNLTAKLYPDAATDQKINWTSSNSDVVSVDNEGRITANMLGTATITATANSNSSVYKTCTVTVQNSVLLTEILLNRYSVTLGVDDSTSLTVYYTPATATTKSVSWTSSNPAVATVSAAGKIHGVSEGTSVITATANDGSGKQAACVVSVTTIIASAVVLNKQTLALVEDESETLTATVYPTNVSTAGVKWSSNNEKVAVVDSDGVVTGTGGGSAVITATSKDASTKYADCVVVVTAKIPTTGLALNLTSFDLLLNDTTTLAATVAPANATDKVKWSSSNNNVATVDEKGKVSGVSTGTAVITATSGGKSVSITVSVVTKLYSTGTIVNCKRRVNVRQKASGASASIGFAYLGDTYKVLDKSGSWYQVQYNANTKAYIWANYINASLTTAGYVSSGAVGTNTTPAPGTTATPTPTLAKTLTITNCVTSVNVRSGAGTTFSKVGLAYLNETFTYTEVTNGWYAIQFNGTTCYVSGSFVKVNG